MSLNLTAIRGAAELAGPLIARAVPEDWKKYKTLYHLQIDGNPSARIMLYGMYSHGKSTLINAILGREAAQMGKPPTTGELDDYEWSEGHCILRDTPGIQAKKLHTRLADESLRECALVAFVVESGAIEESIVWDTLARMLKQRQKVCVIVNDFDECRHRPELLERLKEKLRRHLQDAAHREDFNGDIVAQTPILIANAKQALKGRLEHKERLVEDAGLPEVEQTLIRLASSLEMADVLNTLKRALLQCITNCKQQLARNDQKNLLADAEMQLAAIRGERNRAYDRIGQALDDKLSALGHRLSDLYESGADAEHLKAGLQSLIQTLIDDLGPFIEAETGHAAREIENICLEYDSARERLLEETDLSATSMQQALELVQSIDWKTLLGGIDLKSCAKDLVVTVLKQCKGWLPDLFKGVGLKTMSRWAETVVSALGVAASLAMVFYQVYDDYQVQREAENRARRKAEAIRNAVHDTQAHLRKAILSAVDQIFKESFDKLIAELSQKINSIAALDKTNTEERAILLRAEALLDS